MGRRKMVMRSGRVMLPVPYQAPRSVSGTPSYRPSSPPPGAPSSTTTATLSMSRANRSGMRSSASPTRRSKRSGSTSITARMVGPGLTSPAVAPDGLLHDLDEAQRRAVTSPARPLAILAPAGSGKTRVLTRRIAWRVATGDADASHVLALTFTRRAAGELGDRLRALGLRDGVAAGTFHGAAYAQLRSRWADEGRTPPVLLARKGRLLAGLVAGTPVSAAQLAGEIEWAKARLVGPDGYGEAAAAARRRPPAPPDRIADLYRAYEEEKRRGRLVDFD